MKRAEPVQELGEMRDPLRMRAASGRGGIERAAALHARYAVGNQRKSAGNDRSIHVFFSSDETQAEGSQRAGAWIAQIPATARNRIATPCRPKASGGTRLGSNIARLHRRMMAIRFSFIALLLSSAAFAQTPGIGETR